MHLIMNKIFTRREFIKTTSMAALAFAATNFLAGDARTFAANDSCKVRTRYGIFNGFVGKRGVRTWLGIPYAKPPVGKLRWQRPQKLDATSKEFNAKKFGPSPIQDIDKIEPASINQQSEDCLSLNIWSRNSEGRKPVMVFIPGGAFVSGGSSDPIYNGANLAASHDVVVVTINYRLNVFGFMDFSSIDPAFEASGYLGLLDQVAALSWVKENIENFGGDPDNITIFGESAGAASVFLLSIVPEANVLFKKAIAQSGHLSFYHKPDKSANLAKEFMNIGGYKNMSELMSRSADELRTVYEKLSFVRMLATDTDYFPTADGKFLPLNPFKAFKDGAARNVKFMTGNTAEEYRYWLLYYPNFMEMLKDFHATITPILYEEEFLNAENIYDDWRKTYTGNKTGNELYLEFANQLDWRVGQELTAEYQSAFNETYLYLFSQKATVEKLGSCHAVDLPFVFNNPDPKMLPKPSKKLVEQMQATWVAFATSGNPNNDLITKWKPYTAADRETMEMNDQGWNCHKDLNTHNLENLRYVYEKYLKMDCTFLLT